MEKMGIAKADTIFEASLSEKEKLCTQLKLKLSGAVDG